MSKLRYKTKIRLQKTSGYVMIFKWLIYTKVEVSWNGSLTFVVLLSDFLKWPHNLVLDPYWAISRRWKMWWPDTNNILITNICCCPLSSPTKVDFQYNLKIAICFSFFFLSSTNHRLFFWDFEVSIRV